MDITGFQPKSELREEKIKDKFLAVARNTPLFYEQHTDSDYIIGDEGVRVEVSKENLKVTKVSKEKKHAHMHPPWSREKDEEQIVLGINPKYWNLDMHKENEICVLAHEFYHLKYSHHKPVFWDKLTDALCRMYDRRDNLREAWSNSSRSTRVVFRWEKVFDHQLESIHHRSVDNRMTTAQDQRNEVINKIYGYANVSDALDRLARKERRRKF